MRSFMKSSPDDRSLSGQSMLSKFSKKKTEFNDTASIGSLGLVVEVPSTETHGVQELETEEEQVQSRIDQAKDGDWFVQIHVIEARNLLSDDAQGVADSFVHCVLNIGKQKKEFCTRVVKNENSPVYDEYFKMEFSNVTVHELEYATMQVRVLHSDSMISDKRKKSNRAGDFIGMWEADILESVYGLKDHEFYRQFVSIVNNEAKDERDFGSQGFLKLSVLVLGPEDHMPFHNVFKEREAERKLEESGELGMMYLPSDNKELRFLAINIHDVVNLPLNKDFSQSFYVQIQFGSMILTTEPVFFDKEKQDEKAIATKYGEIKQKIWFCFLAPTLSQKICISLWEKREHQLMPGTSHKKEIGTCDMITLNSIATESKSHQHCALAVYGSPPLLVSQKKSLKHKNKDAKEGMRTSSNLASSFRGCITASFENLSAKKEDGTTRPQESFVEYEKEEPVLSVYQKRTFTLKARVLLGSNLPFLAGKRSMKYGIRISCGKHYIETRMLSPDTKMSTGGCDWSNSGVLSTSFEHGNTESSFSLCPDVIITLRRVDSNVCLLPFPICFRRIPASQLIRATLVGGEASEPDAKWIHLEEDDSINALHNSIFPGSILLQLGFYTQTNTCNHSGSSLNAKNNINSFIDHSCRWKNESITTHNTGMETTETVPCIVKIKVYSGRDLPPADRKTGALDPYLKCTLGNEIKQTSVKYDTRNPTWFETLTFQVNLPKRKDLRPELLMQLWDSDEGKSQDDFVGNLILNLDEKMNDTGADNGDNDANDYVCEPQLKWRNLFFQEPGDIKEGCILVDFVIFDRSAPPTLDDHLPLPKPISSIETNETFVPEGCTKTVELFVIGCRQLRSSSSAKGLLKPFVKFQIGNSAIVQTRQSKRPSPSNCDFHEKLQINDVFLPDDSLLVPVLHVKVLDKSTFSLISRDKEGNVLGTGSTSLKNTKYYKKIMKISDKEDVEQNSVRRDFSSNNELVKPFLKDRFVFDAEMTFDPVYDEVEIMRGKKNKASETTKYDMEPIGRLHLFMRIKDEMDSTANDSVWDMLMKRLTVPTRYDVRVYILNSGDLAAKDANGKSDPYVKMRLEGGKRARDWIKSEVKHETLRPHFFQRFDLTCKYPGDKLLTIHMLDKDEKSIGNLAGHDDLIGKTEYDLENVICCKEWHSYGIRKPIEHRGLFHPSSRHQKGSLKMWLDIIDSKDSKFPVWDISEAPEEEFEVRIVVWKVEGIPPGDEFTDQSDLYVKLKVGNEKWKSTDTHFLAKKGKGSFNYRIKYPVTMEDGGKIRGEGACKLKIQVWDADLLSKSDMLCTAQMNLGNAFKNAWAMKDSGNGYHHLGDVEAQLDLAAKYAKIEKDEGKDKVEDDMKDIPINWRGDPTGFLAGKAENCTDPMYKILSELTDVTKVEHFESTSECETLRNGIMDPSSVLQDANGFLRKIAEKAPDTNPVGDLFSKGMEGSLNILRHGRSSVAKTAAEFGQLKDDILPGEEKPLLNDHETPDEETGEGGYGAVQTQYGTETAATFIANEKKEQDFADASDEIRHKHIKKKQKKNSLEYQIKEHLGLVPPENSKWVMLQPADGITRRVQPRVLLSIEVLPKSLAEERTNGKGRHEPNVFPILPSPEGRVDILKMMYNPIYMLKSLLGGELALKIGGGCACCLISVAFIACSIMFGPMFEILLQSTFGVLPSFLWHYILIGIVLSTVFTFVVSLFKRDDDDDDDDEENAIHIDD